MTSVPHICGLYYTSIRRDCYRPRQLFCPNGCFCLNYDGALSLCFSRARADPYQSGVFVSCGFLPLWLSEHFGGVLMSKGSVFVAGSDKGGGEI